MPTRTHRPIAITFDGLTLQLVSLPKAPFSKHLRHACNVADQWEAAYNINVSLV